LDFPIPPSTIVDFLQDGVVIPAVPLALDNNRRFDERRQIALTRYYHAAGVGGIAVGVHSTQFEIRDSKYGLYEPVLGLVAAEIIRLDLASGRKTVRIAGICGLTEQACREARWAYENGYHLGLLSLGGLQELDHDQLLEHCEIVAREIPLFGFYLQPAVGGRHLPHSFWQRFVKLPNLVAIKVAPFNRYQTLDVVRAVATSGLADRISLYTGNDDHIILDLLSTFVVKTVKGPFEVRFRGGLLGHWACWTRPAIDIFNRLKKLQPAEPIPAEIMQLANEVTDCNAAFFDAANHYRGALCGIHEVLRRQGLFVNNFCLDPSASLSKGQAEEIDRVYHAYPHLNDDAFVKENLDKWLE
jgi:dihydrodipicolinate synthase/N-acetylneuraminate lyase